jgi:hypothetical protein
VPRGLDDSSLHELHVERDGHLVANENATGLERGVPIQAEVLRLIFVVADSPTRVFPQGSLAGGVGPSTVKTTLRVMP